MSSDGLKHVVLPAGHPRDVAPMATEDDELHVRSGSVTDRRPLVGVLYDLLRDHVPPARLEELVRENCIDKTFMLSNGWLARYAQDLARRLLGTDEVEDAFAEACASLKRVPTFEGWRKGSGADVHIHLRISMERIADLLVFRATGSCRREASDAPFEFSEIVLEKSETELYACEDLARFFESYVVDQAFAIAEACWIKHQAGGDA